MPGSWRLARERGLSTTVTDKRRNSIRESARRHCKGARGSGDSGLATFSYDRERPMSAGLVVRTSVRMSTNAPTGTSDGRQPVARGRLEERPFPRLLHQLFSKRLTGCLQLVDDSRDESRVYLRDGAPVHVMRPNDIDRLDQVISEANLVPGAPGDRGVGGAARRGGGWARC